MATETAVKVWAGTFSGENEAVEFARERYDEDGDAHSALWDDIGVGWLDHDFLEVISGDWKEYLRGIAQSPPLPHAIEAATENTAILFYEIDERVESPASGKRLRYLGELRVRL